MYKKSILFFLLSPMMLMLSSCDQSHVTQTKIDLHLSQISTIMEIQETKPRITVWIHGSKGLGKISDFVHATPHQGMSHISKIPPRYRLGKILKTIAESDPYRFPEEHFFVFGWSGKLSFELRRQEAQRLYDALITLLEEYEAKHGVIPHLTLITHSHGGNVALNLATLPNKKASFAIDQMIILACPVQHETEHLIHDPLFKSLFSFYSSTDMLQILDPQGMYITSRNPKRHFELSHRQFPHCEKLHQAKIQINGHGLMHIGFIVERFAKLLPRIIDESQKLDAMAPQEQVLLITT
jgi:hypothetical protein